jgi:STE24 endopeptidase
MVDAGELFGREQVERAHRYWRPRYAAALANGLLGLALLAVLAFGPPGDRLYALFEGWPWWAAAAGFAAATLLLGAILRLPVSFWAGFEHERTWGFSTQTLAGWVADWLKSLGISVALAVPALAGLIGSARAFPSWWPLMAASAASALVLLLAWAAPSRAAVQRAPGRWRTETSRRAARPGRGGAGRFATCSSPTRAAGHKLNAYVSGLGSTRRVVLFDTLAGERRRKECVSSSPTSSGIAGRATSRGAPSSGWPAQRCSSSRSGVCCSGGPCLPRSARTAPATLA